MKRTKSAIIHQQIKHDLASGLYPSGSRLKISQLKERYATSLTPLREALSQLAAEGLLEQHDHRGFFTPQLSYEDILDIRQTRILIETHALTLSLAKGDMDWEASLVSAHHRLGRQRLTLKDIDAWNEAHEQFHSLLIAGSESAHLMAFSRRINMALDKYRRVAEPDARVRQQLDQQHDQLLKLALARDTDAAVQLLTEHIELSSQAAIEALRMLQETD